MAYDEELAGRIRDLVGDEPGLTEQKMFGGLAFLIGGNMAIAASGQGGILVHADPDEADALVASTDAYRWRCVGSRCAAGCASIPSTGTKRQLAKWVQLGTGYARSLPAKR